MLFILIALFCSGFVQFVKAAEIGRKPAFDFGAAPPRNIYLNNVHPIHSSYAAHPSLKIVNGQTAVRGQFCYQAYLQFTDGRSYWSCGGSLITSKLIMTAAHCVLGAKSAVAVLGGWDLSQLYEPGRKIIRVPLSGLRYHEEYDSRNIHNDIATVSLPEPVELNGYICIVNVSCSTKLTADSDNKNNYTVSGWGKTSDRSRTSAILKFTVVPAQAQNSCADFYKTVARYTVIESQMCTSGEGGKSTCNGDSGGPLVQPDSEGNIIQRGIVSLGLNTCEQGAPSVFTDVRYFNDWLCPQL